MMPVCSTKPGFLADRNGESRLGEEQRDPKDDQQQAADELDGARIGRHHIGNRPDAERGNRREHAVAEHGAKARGKPGPKAARHRPLNDQHVDRPDRRRHHDADADPGKHKLDGGENDLRACLQGHGLFALRRWRERGTMPRGHDARLRSFANLRN